MQAASEAKFDMEATLEVGSAVAPGKPSENLILRSKSHQKNFFSSKIAFIQDSFKTRVGQVWRHGLGLHAAKKRSGNTAMPLTAFLKLWLQETMAPDRQKQ